MRAELPAALRILESWNRAHGPYFRIDPSYLRWNFEEQELMEYRVLELAGVPCIGGVAAPAGVNLGIPAKNFWLALWGEIPAGGERDFARALVARSRGGRVLFGADEFHFLPGIPNEGNTALIDAAKAEGFESLAVADYVGSLALPEAQRAVREAEAVARENYWSFLPVAAEDEKNALAGFLEREFPGRWSREFQVWRSRGDTARAYWMTLRDRAGDLMGFARMAVRDRVRPFEGGWTPGALRLPLDPATSWNGEEGALGPIGVAAALRGKGAGRALLGLVLRELAAHGARRIAIDWTNAFKYYEPLGFNRARDYWCAWKAEAK